MEDGGAIILSVAKYYSPSGKAIQDVGVPPETLMSEPEAQVELDENGEPLPAIPDQPEHKQQEDPLLKKAIEIANGQKTAYHLLTVIFRPQDSTASVGHAS